MRVVYIVSLFPCWSETFIVREMRELIRLGVDVRIVSLKHPFETIVQSDAAGLLDRVVYPASPLRNARRALAELLAHPSENLRFLIRLMHDLWRHPLSLGKSLVVWWRINGLVPVLRAMAADHLHAHWATYPSTAALAVTRWLGKPFSFTSHGHDIFLERHLLEKKLRDACFSVTISGYNKRYLGQFGSQADVDRIRVIHCGVSLDDYAFKADGREAGRILAVGRLDEIKGFCHLVDACGVLVARGREFFCDIVGDGPLRRLLHERIDELGLQQRVRLHGALTQEEVRRYLYSAAVFVLPSVRTARGDMDGIPVALMEAMAVGTPVVSTIVSGIPELVESGVTGLLAPPGDATTLANSIEQLLADASYSCSLAQQARARIENDFDVRKETSKLYACLREFHGNAIA